MGEQPMRLFLCRDAGGYGLVHDGRLGIARVGTALIVQGRTVVARDFAKAFYNSAAWIRTSKAYAASRLYICERCGRPAKKYVVHHKKYLTAQNINDPYVALSWDNLQLLCLDCHNNVHNTKNKRKIFFDSSGQVVGVEDLPPMGVPKAP